MRGCVVNLGCKVNRVESDSYEKAIAERGWSFVEADADLVVVNTCTVTGEAEKKTRKAVRQVLRNHPRARVLVTGCAAAISPDVFTSMNERVAVVGKAESLQKVFEVLDELSASAAGVYEPKRTRVGVKVQDGCDNACTYCIVHVARGRAHSRPLDEVRREVVALAEAGVREIVLSGINIGSYDFEGVRLADMLKALLADTECLHGEGEAPVRFRVSSIEPMDVSDEFIRLMASAGGRVCRHLHLPLQSGSSKVLREMARPYDAEDFRLLVDSIRTHVPEISLSTDIIVGFPGETEEDFQDTLELARYCAFSKIHVFPYSKREGTPAAARTDQVEHAVKLERARILRRFSDELRERDYAMRFGSTEYVLVEAEGLGMTESYHEIPVPSHLPQGALVPLNL
ncbi:MAG: tRNA (N(6)-L-threonylcarbamoyladenosine(37)-C(2))-methylthiotransferase MtaB [Eggerthellaceae bacterium]|nr:tRNA (N(6)-L-threonylcarbamoyladenosine(37)-C(2))-methylthiotransferase MtaB [Eggerthellaceae bacterium]